MHVDIIEQKKSLNTDITNIDGKEYILINNKYYIIPTVPEAFTNTDMMTTFVQSIIRSKFFII